MIQKIKDLIPNVVATIFIAILIVWSIFYSALPLWVFWEVFFK